jgi:hypothetical protein
VQGGGSWLVPGWKLAKAWRDNRKVQAGDARWTRGHSRSSTRGALVCKRDEVPRAEHAPQTMLRTGFIQQVVQVLPGKEIVHEFHFLVSLDNNDDLYSSRSAFCAYNLGEEAKQFEGNICGG